MHIVISEINLAYTVLAGARGTHNDDPTVEGGNGIAHGSDRPRD